MTPLNLTLVYSLGFSTLSLKYPTGTWNFTYPKLDCCPFSADVVISNLLLVNDNSTFPDTQAKNLEDIFDSSGSTFRLHPGSSHSLPLMLLPP